MQLFKNDLEGSFTHRPNRFIVHADTEIGPIRAHCPNPGRLTEILNPGCRLIFEKGEEGRKTPYSMVAAYYKNKVVPLYSGRANQVAGELILPTLFPKALDIRAEVTFGKSRFDFLVTLPDKKVFVEVKACTLVEEGIAMFPDAPSERASRHLSELAELPEGYEGHVLFVINHRDAIAFRPNLHTDPLFAQTMKNSQGKVVFHAVSLDCNSEGETQIINWKVPLLFDQWTQVDNQGIYMMIYLLQADHFLEIGKLGKRQFEKGYYVYVGSALKNLEQRVKRHKAKRKNKHWHIDYLRAKADKVWDLPIYTQNPMECKLAIDVAKIANSLIQGFGCTDCQCNSHLFYFKENPQNNSEFLDLLFHYRHTLAHL